MKKNKKTEEISNQNSSDEIKQFCSFRIKGRLYGIDIIEVKEISSELYFTPIFHAPNEVKGYINIRGQIHLVIDLRMLLGFGAKTLDDDSCVVLLKQHVGEAFGLLVDKIGDVVEIEERLIEYHAEKTDKSQSDMENMKAELAIGVCKLENELLEILDSKRVLKIIEKEAVNVL